MLSYTTRRRMMWVIAIYCIAALVILLNCGCTPKQPTGFEVGAPIAAPPGCIDGRQRGVDC